MDDNPRPPRSLLGVAVTAGTVLAIVYLVILGFAEHLW